MVIEAYLKPNIAQYGYWKNISNESFINGVQERLSDSNLNFVTFYLKSLGSVFLTWLAYVFVILGW